MRILLVEDHSDTARMTARLLELLGHQVFVADSVARARILCTGECFDLLLSDLHLPDGDGWELLRELHTRCNTPAIALSAHAFPEDAQKSADAGFIAHINKPFKVAHLLSMIDSVITMDYVQRDAG